MSARTAREQRRAARAAKRRTQRLIVAAGAVVILAVIAVLVYSALSADREATGLQSEDLVVGTGEEAQAGDTVSVHYTGWLEDGTQFDSSLDRGQPFEFTIGQGGVIPGWDQGVPGMRVGGTRRLTIPPDLAYGPGGSGPIPPNATLTFEIQLLEIR
jgi:peptidylprolyl isomerase/FKBP-type peptidyl-prolyl cis-trans isomerase FkpA